MPESAPDRDYDDLVPASLRLVSDSLDDVEALRKATANRYRQATSTWVDEKTGEVRGLGLDERDPLVAGIAALDAALREQEHSIVLQLQRQIRKTVFGPWLKRQRGIGEKTLARLLAAIGDPYLRSGVVELPDGGEAVAQEPRTLGALWAYAGLAVDGGRARHIRKGATQAEVFSCGKPQAKMRAYLIAEGLVKAGVRSLGAEDAPAGDAGGGEGTASSDGYPIHLRQAVSAYGKAYLDRRRATMHRLHAVECVRCGPSGHPAKAGSPWSGAHQQADALRILSKEVLRDLWLLAREHHTGIPAASPADYMLVAA